MVFWMVGNRLWEDICQSVPHVHQFGEALILRMHTFGASRKIKVGSKKWPWANAQDDTVLMIENILLRFSCVPGPNDRKVWVDVLQEPINPIHRETCLRQVRLMDDPCDGVYEPLQSSLRTGQRLMAIVGKGVQVSAVQVINVTII